MVDIIHIKIDDSTHLRKVILKSAIDTTRLIKFNEELKTIREKKYEQINKFDTKIKQIKTSITKLKNELPILEEKKPQLKEEITLKKKPIKKEEMTELEKLSSEIVQLEDKLRRL